MYLLNTKVVSELRRIRGCKPNPNVMAWAGRVEASQPFFAVPILDLQFHALSIKRKDLRQDELLRA